MRPDNRTTAPGPTTPGGSRRGYTLFGLLLAITFVGLVLGLVVAARELANRRHSMTGLAISADGGTIAAAFGDGRVRVFDTSAGRELALSTKPDDDGLPSRAMTLSRDGRLLATSSFVYDSTGAYADGITILDTRLGTFLREIKTQEYQEYFEFSPDSRSLVLESDFAAAMAIDIETGAEAPLLDRAAGNPPDFVSIDFAPDGKTIAATTTTMALSAGPSDIELFNVADGTARGVRYALGAYYVTHVKFSPDSARLALCESISARKPAGGGPTLTMLNAETLSVEATADLGVHGIVYVQEVEFTPDSRSVIVTTASEVYYLDAASLELESRSTRPPGYHFAAARDVGVWALDDDGAIRFYDSSTCKATGVVWDYRKSPWPLLLVSASLVVWFVVFARHFARGRRMRRPLAAKRLAVTPTP